MAHTALELPRRKMSHTRRGRTRTFSREEREDTRSRGNSSEQAIIEATAGIFRGQGAET